MKAYDHKAALVFKKLTETFRSDREQPDYIADEDWNKMLEHWNSTKYKEISETAKKNRASSNSEGTQYHGGSISQGEHKRRMVFLFVCSFNFMI